VEAEAEKIQEIIDNRILGGYSIIGSATVIFEIRQIKNDEKRAAAEEVYNSTGADDTPLSEQSRARAQELRLKGLKFMDAAHLAAAEAADADYLLTVDKGFIKKCSRQNITKVKVINPIDFERR